MTPDTAQFAQFGTFVLDLKQRILTRQGEFVPLAPKDLEVLLVLVRGKGQIVEKKQFIESIWPDTFVEEANLTVSISVLRKVLGIASRNLAGENCAQSQRQAGERLTRTDRGRPAMSS